MAIRGLAVCMLLLTGSAALTGSGVPTSGPERHREGGARAGKKLDPAFVQDLSLLGKAALAASPWEEAEYASGTGTSLGGEEGASRNQSSQDGQANQLGRENQDALYDKYSKFQKHFTDFEEFLAIQKQWVGVEFRSDNYIWDREGKPLLSGRENTVVGVTGPDGRVISGYTWEMNYQNKLERAKNGIRVNIDGDIPEFTAQKPVIEDGRVLIPMRPVLESWRVQCRVSWDAQEGVVTVLDQRGRRTEFRPGELSFREIYPDGQEKTHPLDVPARIINGRVMLPARALLEHYAFRIYWDDVEQLIYAHTNNPSWRKLMRLEEWRKALKEDCVPCALVKEAP